MRLRSLLTMPGIRLEPVWGEEELDRMIRWVVTTDMRDPSRYLSGGELVLTGLVWRTRPEDSEVFAAALARSGVSAVAAWDAEAGTLPADVIEACRRYRLPLFRVPEDLAFATLTERVVRHLTTGRAADLTAVLDRHRRLVAAAAEGAGLGPVLELVERELGTRCWVISPSGRVVGGSAPVDAAGLARAFLTAPRLPYTLAGAPPFSLFPVDQAITSRVAGWFVVIEGDRSDWPAGRRALVAELAAIAALERARADDRLTVEGRPAQELVQLVLSDADPAEIVRRMEPAGLDPALRLVAVAASASGPMRPAEVRTLLREILPRPVMGMVENEVIALLPATGGDPRERLRAAVHALAPGLGDGRLAFGVSGETGAEGLRGAVEEARYARRIAARREPPACVVGHDELATHVLLLASVPDDVRHTFRRRLLDPLRDYDRQHRAGLVRTLETFLDCDGSWTRCADRLHLHVNSLRYRVQRIEELTGRNLSRLEDRVDFFLALRLG